MTDPSKPKTTAAHEVDRILKEAVFYPEHMPRKESKEYAKVHHQLVVVEDRPCLICGVRNSTLGDPEKNPHGAKEIETHHHIIEWALQNAIDLDKFNEHVWPNLQARHPGKYPEPFTQQEMLDFIDHSPDNLWTLCVTGDTRVLMADGHQKPIKDIKVGDMVIGHDGLAHPVTHANTTESDGRVYDIDGVKASGNHPFLTERGWVRADNLAVGEVVYEVRMFAAQMLRLRSIKAKVLDAVIRPVAVNVMDALGLSKLAPKVLGHNVPMLHDTAVFPGCDSDPNPDVPLGGDGGVAGLLVGALSTIESREPALVGAVGLDSPLSFPRLDLESSIADEAGKLDALMIGRTAGHSAEATSAGHRAVFGLGSPAGNDGEFPATGASKVGPIFRGRRTRHIEILPFEGRLYDITVADSASFIANGTVVHNCDIHHRHSLVGIHSITGPIWGAQNLIKDGFDYIPGGQ